MPAWWFLAQPSEASSTSLRPLKQLQNPHRCSMAAIRACALPCHRSRTPTCRTAHTSAPAAGTLSQAHHGNPLAALRWHYGTAWLPFSKGLSASGGSCASTWLTCEWPATSKVDDSQPPRHVRHHGKPVYMTPPHSKQHKQIGCPSVHAKIVDCSPHGTRSPQHNTLAGRFHLLRRP